MAGAICVWQTDSPGQHLERVADYLDRMEISAGDSKRSRGFQEQESPSLNGLQAEWLSRCRPARRSSSRPRLGKRGGPSGVTSPSPAALSGTFLVPIVSVPVVGAG